MKSFRLLTVAAAISALLASCSKDNIDIIADQSVTPLPVGEARVSFVHSAPSTPLAGLRFNDSLVDANVNFGDVLAYRNVKAGPFRIGITQQESSESMSAGMELQSGNSYSVYTLGTAANMTMTTVADSARAVEGNNVRIRFLHFSPDAGEINFRSQEGQYNFALAQARNYNDVRDNPEVAPYVTVRAGQHRFGILNARTNEVMFRNSRSNLQAGRSYTVVAIGSIGATQTRNFRFLVLQDR